MFNVTVEMKSGSRKYTVKMDGKVIGTRTTERKYTHAVVIEGDNGYSVLSYHGKRELAEKKARTEGAYFHSAEVIELFTAEVDEAPAKERTLSETMDEIERLAGGSLLRRKQLMKERGIHERKW